MHQEAECDDDDGSDLADLPRTSEDEWLMWIEGRSGKPSEEPAEESPSKGDLDKSTTSDHPENENETQPMVDHPQCVVAPSRRSPRRPVRASRMSLQRRRRTASGSSAQGGEDDGEDGQDEGEADDDDEDEAEELGTIGKLHKALCGAPIVRLGLILCLFFVQQYNVC